MKGQKTTLSDAQPVFNGNDRYARIKNNQAASGLRRILPGSVCPRLEDSDVDVLVIGAGGAGLKRGGIRLQENGAGVIVVEKNVDMGGDNARTTALSTAMTEGQPSFENGRLIKSDR